MCQLYEHSPTERKKSAQNGVFGRFWSKRSFIFLKSLIFFKFSKWAWLFNFYRWKLLLFSFESPNPVPFDYGLPIYTRFTDIPTKSKKVSLKLRFRPFWAILAKIAQNGRKSHFKPTFFLFMGMSVKRTYMGRARSKGTGFGLSKEHNSSFQR